MSRKVQKYRIEVPVIVNLKQLPDGRVCYHWLRLDDKGPIKTADGVRMSSMGPIRIGGVRGTIVCNPTQNTVTPQVHGREVFVCSYTDDPRAATCPKCLETQEYKDAMAKFG